jgi:Beta-propeller repeat
MGIRPFLVGLLAISFLVLVPTAKASHGPFAAGDLLAGVGRNTVQWRDAGGVSYTAHPTLTTPVSSPTTSGMAFDLNDNLYVTGYTSNAISRFDPTGIPTGTFGTGFNSHPESISFDTFGNAYVGQEGGSRDILKFAPAGSLSGAFDAAPDGKKGTDRLDVSSDQCVILYTSQAKLIKQFDACPGDAGPPGFGQLPNFTTAPLPGTEAWDVKALVGSLPTGESLEGHVLVADTQAIYQLNDVGAIVQTYDGAGLNCWTALAPDTTTGAFWAGDRCSSTVARFPIDLDPAFTPPSAGFVPPLIIRSTGARTSVQGLAVNGGLTAATAADVSVALTDTPDPVSPSKPGQDPNLVRYEAAVTNSGPGLARDLTFTSSICFDPTGDPDECTAGGGATIASASGTGWQCPDPIPPATTSVTCTFAGPLGDFSPDFVPETSTIEVLVRSPQDTGTLENSASVTANEPDQAPDNNTDLEETVVENNPNVFATFCLFSDGCVGTTDPEVDNTFSQITVPPLSPPGVSGIAQANGGPSGGALTMSESDDQTFDCGTADSTQELEFFVPEGYEEPTNPIVGQMSVTLAGSGLTGTSGPFCIAKTDPITGEIIRVIDPLPPCTTPGVASPSPCENDRFVSGGMLTVEFLILSGDPRGHN